MPRARGAFSALGLVPVSGHTLSQTSVCGYWSYKSYRSYWSCCSATHLRLRSAAPRERSDRCRVESRPTFGPRSGGGPSNGADGHFLRKSKNTSLEGWSTAKPHGLTERGSPKNAPKPAKRGRRRSRCRQAFFGAQQILGRSSPPGGGSMVCAPMAVVITTLPAGSGRTSPMTAASFE